VSPGEETIKSDENNEKREGKTSRKDVRKRPKSGGEKRPEIGAWREARRASERDKK
jgi:hypothetical protein